MSTLSRNAAFPIAVFLSACTAEQEPPTEPEAEVPSLPSYVTPIPEWRLSTSEVFVGDINADSRLDLVLTSHSANRVRPFLQGPDGQFDALDPLDGVGFHPNGVTLIERPGEAPILVQNAETRHELRLYRFEEGALQYFGALPGVSPLTTLSIDWPCWPDSLFTVPRAGKDVELYLDVDAPEASFSERVSLSGSGARSSSHLKSPIRADLDGDGRNEILFVVSRTGAIRVLHADEAGNLYLDDLGALPPEANVQQILAEDVNGDGRADLFVVAGRSEPLRVLASREGGGYESHEVALAPEYNHLAVLWRDADGAPTLLLGRQHSMVALRFQQDLSQPPERKEVEKASAVGWVVGAAADFDRDGVQDLAISASGLRDVPTMIVKGPLWGKMDWVLAQYSSAADLGLRPDAAIAE